MNIPRWDDTAAYPRSQDELSDDQWIWEFLRRADDYLFDWMKYGSDDPWAGIIKYDLDRLIDPAIPAKELNKHIFRSLCGSLIGSDSHSADSLLSRNYELVIIHPDRNLDKQWARAKELICSKRNLNDKKQRPRKRRRGTNNLILLLRVLDGKKQGAPFEVLGKELFNSNARRAKEEYEKANELWLTWFDSLPF